MREAPLHVFTFVFFFFFFSSRRRHTRCSRDWSSDVCSSDLLPAPYGGGWIPNRVRALPPSESAGSGVEVPRDALVPDPATGLLRLPASAASAQQKVTYRVMLSKFHDGTKMTVADIVYPFAFAYRWSARDPEIDRATAVLREWLAPVQGVAGVGGTYDIWELQGGVTGTP